MSFVWPDYMTVATDLLNLGSPTARYEALARAAVSRAYYAAHHVARVELTSTRGKTLPNVPGGIHMQVIQCLFTVKDKAWSSAGIELDELRKARVQADYELSLPASWGADTTALKKKAAFEIERALRLLQQIPNLP